MSIRRRTSKKAKNGYVYEVYFNYKVNGISERYSKSGFVTKKEAKEHEALKKAELKTCGKIIKITKKTFGDVYKEFLEVGANQYQENTINNTKRYYEYCKNDLSFIPIADFDYQFLQKYFNSKKDKGIESNKNLRKMINRVMKYAIKVGYIQSNPLNLVTVVGVENHIEHENVLKYDDFIRLTESLEALNDFRKQAYSIAIKIGYYTGLRVSEVLALNKEDILMEDNSISVNKKLIYSDLSKEELHVSDQMKSKKSKANVPLAKPLKDELKIWFKINPYDNVVCDEDGWYIHPDIMSSCIKKVAKELNISFHFHMLRHTFATNLVTNNVDLKTAQELMRHTHIDTTMSIYTHINDEKKLNTINDVFETKSVEKVSKSTNHKNINYAIN